MARRLSWRHGLWFTAILLGSVVALVAVALLLFLNVPSVREAALSKSLHRVMAALPGDLRVERMRWPHRGELQLDGVLWTAPSAKGAPGDRLGESGGVDTLLAADRMMLRFDWGPLFRREVQVRTLVVDALRGDVPALTGALAAADSTRRSAPPSGSGYNSAFPREGALAGLPSVALDTLRVDAVRVTFAPGLDIVDAHLDFGADLRSGREPSLSLRRLEVTDGAGIWRVDQGQGVLDPAAGRVDARVAVEVQGQPLTLTLASPQDNAVRFVLSPHAGVVPPATWGAAGMATLQREGLKLLSCEFDLELRTPSVAELRQMPLLQGRLPETLPELEAVDATLRGSVQFETQLAAQADLDLMANAWLEGGLARAHLRDGASVLDTLEIRLPELVAAASGSLRDDRVDARAQVTARGVRGVRPFLPADVALPDSLGLELRAIVSGISRAPDLTATLRSRFVLQGTRVERLDLDARMPAGAPARIDVQARAYGFGVSTRAEITRGERLVASLWPLHVLESPRGDVPPLGRGDGRVVLDPVTGAVTVTGLLVNGDLGWMRGDAQADSSGNARFSLDAQVPTLPRTLAARMTADPVLADSLRARWQRYGTYLLRFQGRRGMSAAGATLNMEGSFSLPGPRVFAPLFPEGAAVDSLGDFLGDFDLALAPRSWGTSIRADVILDRTTWLDSARVVVRTEDRRVRLETVALELEGIRLGGSGSVVGEEVEFDGTLGVARLDFLKRFLGEAGEGLEGALAGSLSVRGSRTAPRAEVAFTGDARYRAYQVPGFKGRARYGAGGLNARFGLTRDAQLDQVTLDRADLGFTSRGDSLLPARITVDVEGADLGLRQRLEIQHDGAWTVDVDTLDMRARDLRLDALHPFRVTVNPETRSAAVDSMNLAGNLGTLSLRGSVAPDRADLDLSLDAQLPEQPPFLSVPEGLWPDRAVLDLRARGADELRAVGRMTGLDFGDRTDARFDLEVSAGDSTVDATFSLQDAAGELVHGDIQIPGRVSLAPVRAELRDGPVHASVRLIKVPLPRPVEAGRPPDWTQPLQLDGELGLRGLASDPAAYGDFQFSFPGWPRLGPYRLDIEGELTGDAASPWSEFLGAGSGRVIEVADSLQTTLSLLAETWSVPRASRLRTAFAFSRGEKRVLKGHLGMPLEVSLHPFLVESAATDSLDAALDIRQLALRDLDALLPPDASLGGTLDLDLRAQGPRENPEFKGTLKARNVKAELAGKARASARSDLVFGGNLARPEARGKIEVETAVIQIPEQQKTLLPTRGEALLWDIEGLEGTPGDTLHAGASRDSVAGPGALEADLDVTVVIPNAFWIRGRGLDVELAGELRVIQKGTAPTVTGELKAVQGRLVFLGRTFEVERGDVAFYGGDTVNPSLDLLLTTRIQGTTFNISVQGTAIEPRLTLSSDPEMTEGDIMAFLLFGRPIDELDTEQQGLLEQRAGEVARSFAMAQIEARLAQQLGVDLISIRTGNGDDQSDSLVIGKYLSRRALLKYEQALEGTANFFLNLEYLLTRNLKLDTLIGPRSQSGIEIRWGTEY